MQAIKLLALAVVLAGCASVPAPTERLAQTEASIRSAQEVGANNAPQAQLHLRLAQEQLAKARALMTNGDNELADLMLMRAQADGELALALAKASNEQGEAQKTVDQIQQLQNRPQ